MVETAAYFVVAEALTNAAKHAPGAAGAVRLSLDADRLRGHISSIFGKLDLPAGGDDHRRVLAVLEFLRAGD